MQGAQKQPGACGLEQEAPNAVTDKAADYIGGGIGEGAQRGYPHSPFFFGLRVSGGILAVTLKTF